jgi:hypothetical protein
VKKLTAATVSLKQLSPFVVQHGSIQSSDTVEVMLSLVVSLPHPNFMIRLPSF